MGWIALICALAAVICAALPGPALYAGMGLGIAGLGLGVAGYRRRRDPGPARLAAAGAVTLGLIALILAAARYGLILAVVRRLEGML